MGGPTSGGAQLVGPDGIALPVSGPIKPTGNISLSDRGFLTTLDAANGAFTATLPDPAKTKGQPLIYKKIDSGSNAITISQFAAETIDGATSVVLTKQNESIMLISDGTNWQLAIAPTGTFTGLSLTQSVSAAATPPVILTVTGAANTAVTLSTEAIDVSFALNRTVQWATGALTTQRAVVFAAPTYGFVGASTITTAATVAITGAPIAGTNATITSSWALWIQAGGASITGTPTYNTLAVTGPIQTTGTAGVVTITAGISTGGAIPILTVTGAASTAQTLSTEINFVNFALNQTVQWATGALTNQRCVFIQAPTLAFVGASTVTTASTLCVSGPPIAGTNATLTNSWGLLVSGGGANITGTVQTGGTQAVVAIAGAVNTAGACPILTVTGAASTAQTLSTEINFINFNLAQTVQWATGALATQRCVLFQAPTFTAVGGSTFTRAATVAISGAPVASTNITITKNSYALLVQGGDVCLAGSGSALATNAILGHTWIPSCAGTPTGVVVGETGAAAIIVDTTGNKIWANVLGTWKGVAIA